MKKPTINIVPLVDIMLVLILILLCLFNSTSPQNSIYAEQHQTSFIINIHNNTQYSCKKIDDNSAVLLENSSEISDIVTTIQKHTNDKSVVIQIVLDQSTTDCVLFRRVVQELHKEKYTHLKLTLESQNAGTRN